MDLVQILIAWVINYWEKFRAFWHLIDHHRQWSADMPTPALTTLRSTIAAVLDNPGVWSTFNFPPATILANSVVLIPQDPYLTPSNNSQNSIGPLANFKIMMTIPALDNQGSLQSIESTIVAVWNKLCNSALVIRIGTVSGPSILSAASGDLLTSDINISLLTTWS